MSHTGAAALRMLGDKVGLTGRLAGALAQPRLLVITAAARRRYLKIDET